MKNRQVTVGAIISYATIAFNILSGLLYTPWIIRSVGDDQYALYALALSIINIFLMDFGIGSAITRFLSDYYAKGNYNQANRFMGIVYKVFIAISAAIALLLIVFYVFIGDIYTKFSHAEIVVFKRLFVIVGASSVISFPFTSFNGILTANEKFIYLKACSLGQKVLDVSLIILFLKLNHGVYTLVLVHAISNFTFLLIKYTIIKTKTKQKTDMFHWDGKIAKELFGYSAWYTVKIISQRCIFNIMPTIIAALVGTAEVALFSLAATLEAYMFTFTDAVNGMFMPKITRIMNDDDPEQLNSLMIKVGKFHVYTVGLLVIGFISLGQHFVNVWLGERYELVFWCALILIIPCLIDSPQQIAKTSLLVKGIVRQQALVYVLMALFNLTVAFVLIPVIGVLGAALSVLVAYTVRTVGLNLLYSKYLPIKLGQYFVKTYGRWIIVATIVIPIGFFINNFICINGWLGLLVKILLLSSLYLILIYFICFDKRKKYKF